MKGSFFAIVISSLVCSAFELTQGCKGAVLFFDVQRREVYVDSLCYCSYGSFHAVAHAQDVVRIDG